MAIEKQNSPDTAPAAKPYEPPAVVRVRLKTRGSMDYQVGKVDANNNCTTHYHTDAATDCGY